MRRLLGTACVLLGLAAGPCAADLMEQVDYVRIGPMPVPDAARVEVIEFFYYGCDACDRFQPHLSRWLASKPPDVDFHRIPALRRTAWIPLTRLYYTLHELGLLPRLHEEVYRSIHHRQQSLQGREDLVEWAANRQIDPAQFETVLMSDAVLIKVQQSRDATIAYSVTSTPSLVVDGRFLTSGALLGDITRLIPVLDEMIDLARASR